MGLILDTSVLIAAEKKQLNMDAFVSSEVPEESFCISTITASELLHGLHRALPSIRERRSSFVENILLSTPSLAFDFSCARYHSKLWSDLESKGQRIGTHDMMIAATCLRYGHKLATLNEREFRRVEGLELVNVRKYALGS